MLFHVKMAKYSFICWFATNWKSRQFYLLSFETVGVPQRIQDQIFQLNNYEKH